MAKKTNKHTTRQDVDELIHSTAWRSVSAQEGLRVLEEERGSKQRARAAALCRKMQVSWSARRRLQGFAQTYMGGVGL